MNIFNALRNFRGGNQSAAVAPPPAPSISIVSAPGSGAEVGNGNLARGEARDRQMLYEAGAMPRPTMPLPAPPKPAAPVLDEWERKFKRKPYYDPERGNFSIEPKFYLAIEKRAGFPLVTDEQMRVISGLEDRFQAAWEGLNNCSHDSVRRKWMQLMEDNARAVAAGQTPVAVHSKERMQEDVKAERGKFRGDMRAIGVLVQPIVREFCDRLAKAARIVAEQLDAEEKKAAAEFGVQHWPSLQLAMVVYLAIEGHSHLANQFVPGACCAPAEALRMIGHTIEKQTTKE